MQTARRLSFRGCVCCTPLPDSRRRPLVSPRVRASASSSGGRALAAAPRGSVPSVGTHSGASSASAVKPHRIDIHHHVAPPKYIEEMRALLQPPTLAWTPEKTLADMDEAGVALAITSITTPGVWIGDNAQGRRVARDCNDYSARLAADHPGRFGMFAALPLPDIEGSLREIEYGLDVLKADGVVLFTSYRDKWLGDPAFEPVMEELNRRQVLVFTHPEAPLCCRNLIPGINEAVIEYGTDTARAIARILFSGTATRFPNIRWIFSHGGGSLPMFADRFVRAGRLPVNVAHVPNGVWAELQKFYYDVAQIEHPMGLAAITRMVPISQILWGTDFPFRPGSVYVKGLAEFGFSLEDLRKIERDNALALLPRWQ
ncbi:MAG: amidohydrolase [Hyphomicrobiales bacterium]|nr:amidohydrolase [Hyphomicrobiales bacterium]